MKVFLRYFILLNLAINLAFQCYSQSSFSIRLGSTGKNESIVGLIEDDNGNYFASGSINTIGVPESGNALLVKITSSGDTIIREIRIEDKQTGGGPITSNANGQYLVFGGTYDPVTNNRLVIICIDSNLNLLWYKPLMFSCQNYGISGIKLLNKTDGGFFIAASLLNSEYFPIGVLVAELNSATDTIRTNYLAFEFGSRVGSITYNQDSTRLWLWGHGFSANSYSQRVELDLNLLVDEIRPLPNDLENYIAAKWVSDTSIVIAGNHQDTGPPPREEDISCVIVNSDLNPSYQRYIGTQDTINYLGYENGIDFISSDSIFILGDNPHSTQILYTEPNSLLVGLYDKALNCRFLKNYGGDAYFVPATIIATRDGGCLFVALEFDLGNNSGEFDVHFFKLNSEGLITSISNKILTCIEKDFIFPNPARDIVFIETTSEKSTLKLFDISGKIILSVNLCKGMNNISLNKYQAGFYYAIIESQFRIIQSKQLIILK